MREGRDTDATRAAARAALRVYMRYWSEERWNQGWLQGLEYELASTTHGFDGGAFPWLVDQAGGWFTWDTVDAEPRFVEGTIGDLWRRESMRTVAPDRTDASPEPPANTPGGDPDQSWEAMVGRVWGIRYKIAGLLAISAVTALVGARLDLDENTSFLIAAAIVVLLLVPDPPLWRMPLRSPRRRPKDERPTPGAHATGDDQPSPR